MNHITYAESLFSNSKNINDIVDVIHDIVTFDNSYAFVLIAFIYGYIITMINELSSYLYIIPLLFITFSFHRFLNMLK